MLLHFHNVALYGYSIDAKYVHINYMQQGKLESRNETVPFLE